MLGCFSTLTTRKPPLICVNDGVDRPGCRTESQAAIPAGPPAGQSRLTAAGSSRLTTSTSQARKFCMASVST